MLIPLSIGPSILIIALLFVLFTLILTLIALVDILGNEFKDNDKLIWVLVVIFLGFIGAILYFAMGQQQKLPKS